jgi:hypothetical protein
MLKNLLIILLTCFAFGAIAQDRPLPRELSPFVRTGYEVLDFQTGDLNLDKKPDAILVLKPSYEDTIVDDSVTRILLLLTRNASGKLQKIVESHTAILCYHCGGVMGDPFSDLSILPGQFNISFYGGSNWRWGRDYFFKYQPAKKDWLLEQEIQTSFYSADPDQQVKEAKIPRSELGIVSIRNFSAEPVYDDSHWKVTAAKTYFFDSPLVNGRPRKGFLVKGDEVTGIRELVNFVEVSFENSKGEFTTGYVFKKDLQKINATLKTN